MYSTSCLILQIITWCPEALTLEASPKTKKKKNQKTENLFNLIGNSLSLTWTPKGWVGHRAALLLQLEIQCGVQQHLNNEPRVSQLKDNISTRCITQHGANKSCSQIRSLVSWSEQPPCDGCADITIIDWVTPTDEWIRHHLPSPSTTIYLLTYEWIMKISKLVTSKQIADQSCCRWCSSLSCGG